MRSFLLFSLFLFAFFAFPGNAVLSQDAEPTETPEVEAEPEPPHPLTFFVTEIVKSAGLPDERAKRVEAMTFAVYESTNFQPIWKGNQSSEERLAPLSNLLGRHGLNAAAVSPFSLDSQLAAKNVEKLTAEEVRSTARLAEACLTLRHGHPMKDPIWPHWSDSEDPGNHDQDAYINFLRRQFAQSVVLNNAEPAKVAQAFVPKNWVYQRLWKTWQDYQDPPTPPQLKISGTVSAGREFDQAKELATYLNQLSFLSNADNEAVDGVFTEAMGAALKSYQSANGLWADGILGPKTAYNIGKGPKDNSPALELNMHRARQLPNNMGPRFLVANVPAGEVYGFDKEGMSERMRIVFGQNTSEKRTPFFRDTMEKVVFRPYWWMPKSIATKEYLPRIRRDWSYLKRNGYQIVTGTGTVMKVSSRNLDRVERGALFLRQNSGSGNALGRVKFIFPNEHYVYMHDTPSKSLFNRTYRAHSHGCVRLQHPEAMANWVLKTDPDWNKDSVHYSMYKTSKHNEVELKQQPEVFIVYFTAFPLVDKDEGVAFYSDVYKRDSSDRSRFAKAAQL